MKKLTLSLLLPLMFSASQLFAADDLTIRVSDDQVSKTAITETHRITLENDWGKAHIVLRKPLNSKESLPVMVILSGAGTGADSLNFVPESRHNIVVAIDYPMQNGLKDEELVREVAKNAHLIQIHITAALFWLGKSKEAHALGVDRSRISVVAVSFGTFVAPVALRAVQILGVKTFSSVFAFGGANLNGFLRHELEKSEDLSDSDRENIMQFAEGFLETIDPARHLPKLRGQILVINGKRDQVIPKVSSQALVDALPADSTTVVELDTAHIDVDQTATIKQTMGTVQEWLLGIGAINPEN